MARKDPQGTETIRYATSDGFELAGIKTAPHTERPRGWVILAHGILESKEEYAGFYRDISDALATSGFGSIRFDFRGHGESSGTTMDISVVGDVLDLGATVGQIPRSYAGRIGLIATSFGAGPSIFAAEGMADKVGAVVLIAPVLDYTRTFLIPSTPWAASSFTTEALEKIDSKGYLLLDQTAKLSPRLIQEFRLLKPFESLRALKIPSLIIHGDRDSMVPYSVSNDAARGSSNVSLHTLRGADHGFTDADDDTDVSPRSISNRQELVRTTVDFIASHLG